MSKRNPKTPPISDEEVEAEIEKLKNDPDTKFGRKAENFRKARRQYMHKLRWYQRIGAELRAKGINEDNFEDML